MICTFSEIFDAVFNDIKVKYKVKILGKKPCLCSPISELHSKLICICVVIGSCLYQPVQDLAAECETRSVVLLSSLISYFLLALSLFPAQFSQDYTSARSSYRDGGRGRGNLYFIRGREDLTEEATIHRRRHF